MIEQLGNRNRPQNDCSSFTAMVPGKTVERCPRSWLNHSQEKDLAGTKHADKEHLIPQQTCYELFEVVDMKTSSDEEMVCYGMVSRKIFYLE